MGHHRGDSGPDLNRLDRVTVVGTSCAGKTTLARALGRTLGVSHTELDALYWGPNWTPRPPEEFRSRVQTAVAAPSWVIDGSYSVVRDLIWPRATTLVWLNYSLSRVFPRSVLRTIRRVVTQEELFSGNRESLRGIVDPDWIPWWVLRTYWRRRREYAASLQQPEFAHLQVLEFTHPNQAKHFLEVCSA